MKPLQQDELIFRKAGETDLSSLLGLLKHLHGATDLLEQEQARATWSAMMEQEGLTHYLAEIDERLAAACDLVVVPNLTRNAKPYGWIENVVTHPEYRRRGIGKRLLSHVLDEAWKQGCYKVMLMTGSKRPEIHEFYEKAGFQGRVKTAFLAVPPPKGISSETLP